MGHTLGTSLTTLTGADIRPVAAYDQDTTTVCTHQEPVVMQLSGERGTERVDTGVHTRTRNNDVVCANCYYPIHTLCLCIYPMPLTSH